MERNNEIGSDGSIDVTPNPVNKPESGNSKFKHPFQGPVPSPQNADQFSQAEEQSPTTVTPENQGGNSNGNGIVPSQPKKKSFMRRHWKAIAGTAFVGLVLAGTVTGFLAPTLVTAANTIFAGNTSLAYTTAFFGSLAGYSVLATAYYGVKRLLNKNEATFGMEVGKENKKRRKRKDKSKDKNKESWLSRFKQKRAEKKKLKEQEKNNEQNGPEIPPANAGVKYPRLNATKNAVSNLAKNAREKVASVVSNHKVKSVEDLKNSFNDKIEGAALTSATVVQILGEIVLKTASKVSPEKKRKDIFGNELLDENISKER